MGKVYLLHFNKPYHHAEHYIGYTKNLKERIKRHLSGNGARLIEVITKKGITFECVKVTKGDRKLERKWHNRDDKRLCPVCNPKKKEVKKNDI